MSIIIDGGHVINYPNNRHKLEINKLTPTIIRNQLFKKWKLEDSNNKNSEFSKAFRQIKSKYGRHVFFHVVDRVLTLRKINAARYVAQKREEEIGKGQYGRPSESVSQQLVVTEKMGEWLSRKYRH